MANVLGVMNNRDYGQYAWGGPQKNLIGGNLESAGLGNTNNSDNSRDWNWGEGYLNNGTVTEALQPGAGQLAPDAAQPRTDADVQGNAAPIEDRGFDMGLDLPEYTSADARFEPPEYVPAELEALPEFTAPEYDDSRVAERAQGLASTSVRRLGQSVRQSLSGDIENPNARRMVERGALGGYSQGLEDVTAASRNQAYSEYDQDYGREFNTAERNYGTNLMGVQARNAANTQEAQINYQRSLGTYTQEWQRQQDEAMINFQTEQQELITNHLAALQDYFDRNSQTTTIIEEQG